MRRELTLKLRLKRIAAVILTTIAVFGLLGILAACQKSGSGDDVFPPVVQFTCTTGSCASASNKPQFIVFATQAGCSNPEFSAIFSSSGFATCSGGTCRGQTSGWTSDAQSDIHAFPADVYDLCAYIYFNGGPNSGPLSGDVLGSLENITVDGVTPVFSITSWSSL